MKRINKVASLVVLLGLTCSISFAGGKKDKEVSTEDSKTVIEAEAVQKKTSAVHAAYLNGPTGIPFAYMIENKKSVAGIEVTYEKFANPQMALPKLLNGEVDIGVLPVNTAAKVYNTSDGALVCIGVCGNGNLSLITYDEDFKGFESLKGQTLYVAGKGATPEYMTRYLLEKRGIMTGEGEGCVTLDYSIAPSDLPAAIISRKIKYAVLPEPFATVAVMKSPAVKKAVDIQKEYAQEEGRDSYPLSVLVSSKAFAQANPDFIKAFEADLTESIDWTVHNANKAGVMVQSVLGIMAPVASRAIPSGGFVYSDAQSAKADLENLYLVFLHFDDKSIGGRLPDEGFYWAK